MVSKGLQPSLCLNVQKIKHTVAGLVNYICVFGVLTIYIIMFNSLSEYKQIECSNITNFIYFYIAKVSLV